MLLPQVGLLPGLQNSQSIEPTSGWELDQRSQKFTFIIQIPPNQIESFAQGPSGSELPVRIPDRLVGRIEQLAIRIDNKELPRVDPPMLNSRSQASIEPTIQNLALMRYAPQAPTNIGQWENNVGWQLDNQSGRYTYLVQIPVNNLQQFMSGPTGNEMIIPIHPTVKDYVEQVTIRIGNGTLPKGAIPQSVLARYDALGDDNIQNLGGSSLGGVPAFIDPTPIATQSDFGQPRGGQGAVLPTSPVTPNFNNNLRNDSSSMTNPSMTNPSMSNPPRATTNDLVNNNRDRDMGVGSRNNNPMLNNMLGRQDTPDPRGWAGQGSDRGVMPTQTQPMLPPAMQPDYVNTMNPAYAQMASNLFPANGNAGFSNVPTSAFQQGPGGNPFTQVSNPQFAGSVPPAVPLVANSNTDTTPQKDVTPPVIEKPSIGFNWALAALVLLGFNIYQFFWMSNARIKYRQMVMSKRSTRLEPTM
ncbi:hypothetical protein SH449x_003701 [Pirellulaceae bacterium SH449]